MFCNRKKKLLMFWKLEKFYLIEREIKDLDSQCFLLAEP